MQYSSGVVVTVVNCMYTQVEKYNKQEKDPHEAALTEALHHIFTPDAPFPPSQEQIQQLQVLVNSWLVDRKVPKQFKVCSIMPYYVEVR